MTEIVVPDYSVQRPGLQGFVAEPPAALGAPFTVLCPAFSREHAFEIRRWQARATTIPAVGDEVLVVFDDAEEPWVAAWWPSGGDTPIEAAGEVEEWLTGSTVPGAGLGSNGDLYLRTTTADVYEKAAGAWSIVANIKGATGATGSTGSTGATGPEGPAGKGADNRGIVTALPSTSLVKGETLCAFKAATGVYWWLLYTEEATYPWAKIGGPPMESHLTGEPLSTSSATYQSSGAPSITAPLAMEADLVWGAQLLASQVNELNEIRIAAFKGSTEVDWMASAGSQTFDGHGGIKRQRTTLAKSEAVTTRYASVSSKSSKFYGLQIQLDPVRVG